MLASVKVAPLMLTSGDGTTAAVAIVPGVASALPVSNSKNEPATDSEDGANGGSLPKLLPGSVAPGSMPGSVPVGSLDLCEQPNESSVPRMMTKMRMRRCRAGGVPTAERSHLAHLPRHRRWGGRPHHGRPSMPAVI